MSRPTFEQMAVALAVAANVMEARAQDCAIVAARIGLSPMATALVVNDKRADAALVREAQDLLRRMGRGEPLVRLMLEQYGAAA